ncbi:MAG: SUMF1/EgtB/PvdO family nonheme iron enzyme [Magnetococcus sp. MYC-9]
MNIRTLLHSATRWRRQARTARRLRPTRSGQPAAVRVQRRTASSPVWHRFRSPVLHRFRWPVLLVLLLVGLAYLGWPFASRQPGSTDGSVEWPAIPTVFTAKESPKTGDWKACLPGSAGPSTSPKSPFVLHPVPAGAYALPTPTSGLHPFTRHHKLDTIQVETAFLMQEQPVSQALFKEYAESIARMPTGEEKERLLSRLGQFWSRGENTAPAVKGISLEAATDFSHWLSQQTGCSYEVPSREEWAAAVIHLYNSGSPLPKPSDSFDANPLRSLLQGGGEWTRSPCPLGFYLVGGEDWGVEAQDSQPSCMPALFSVAGFRVVLHPDRRFPPAAETTEKTNH